MGFTLAIWLGCEDTSFPFPSVTETTLPYASYSYLAYIVPALLAIPYTPWVFLIYRYLAPLNLIDIGALPRP